MLFDSYYKPIHDQKLFEEKPFNHLVKKEINVIFSKFQQKNRKEFLKNCDLSHITPEMNKLSVYNLIFGNTF